jgi:RNA polymerase sigma factor (sigma-70 family)
MLPEKESSFDIDKLINASQLNDRKAQMRLYDLYSLSMYNTSLRIVRNTMLAEDIVQESFLKAFLSLAQFRREVPFVVWLRRIVINKSLDELRKKKNEFVQIEENTVPSEIYRQDEDAGREVNEELIQRCKIAINELSEKYRVIFSLFYFEGYDHDEIAQILGITASTSRSQLTRARQKIAGQLKMKTV